MSGFPIRLPWYVRFFLTSAAQRRWALRKAQQAHAEQVARFQSIGGYAPGEKRSINSEGR